MFHHSEVYKEGNTSVRHCALRFRFETIEVPSSALSDRIQVDLLHTSLFDRSTKRFSSVRHSRQESYDEIVKRSDNSNCCFTDPDDLSKRKIFKFVFCESDFYCPGNGCIYKVLRRYSQREREREKWRKYGSTSQCNKWKNQRSSFITHTDNLWIRRPAKWARDWRKSGRRGNIQGD